MRANSMSIGESKAADVGPFRDSAIDNVSDSDRNVLSIVRCGFAVITLLLVTYRFHRSQGEFGFVHLLILVYLFYSLVYLFLSKRSSYTRRTRTSYWIDLLIFIYVLITLKLHDSVFFAMLLYPVLVASRLADARAGATVTLAATTAYLVTALPYLQQPRYETIEVAIRAICLLLLGSIVVYWAASEEAAWRKLKFLLRINEAWNPRMGMDRTVLVNLTRLAALYQADTCILVVRHVDENSRWMMYSTTTNGTSKMSEINEQTAAQLTTLRHDISTAYSQANSWFDRFTSQMTVIGDRRDRNRINVSVCQGLLNILDAKAFATAPYAQRNGSQGRIFITSNSRDFSQADVRFLIQVSRVIALVIENMFLTEQVITKATDYERLQISRDMHDTTIQPYIGLKLALEALRREAAGSLLEGRIAEIINMTAVTISDLRSYTSQLREKTSLPGENLMAAVLKQADVFSRFYGIRVNVQDEIDAPINGQIAAEILQIISEGLSNILRHTNAKRADVSVCSDTTRITLKIGNKKERVSVSNDKPAEFTPRSISERAASLGGTLSIMNIDNQYTLVRVEIPNSLNLET